MTETLKCLVVDDEPVALDILQDYIDKVPFLQLAGACRSALQAMELLRERPVELFFLDINMPDLTGLQFLNILENPPLVIFTTAYSEYALDSYDYDAVDYLLKPIEFDRFFKAAHRALTRRRSTDSTASPGRDDYLLLKSGTKLHRIRWCDILYVKGAGNYLTFETTDQSIMVLMTMHEALDQLPAGEFARIHKSYIVGLRHLSVIEKDNVRIGQERLPVGDAYREDFFKKLEKS
ncbi:MAG: response regulator transcription factor [Acidobacteria bacterium]|nr:response regulator transcription factor [Acidobacteriota bacterium]